jgi:hypothetical protein
MDDRINPYAAPQAYQEPIPVAAATLTPLRRGLRIFLGIVLLLLALTSGGIVAARISNLGIATPAKELPMVADWLRPCRSRCYLSVCGCSVGNGFVY